jgi:hypothetical protein
MIFSPGGHRVTLKLGINLCDFCFRGTAISFAGKSFRTL